jgi:methyl-accepting chemotaxis protein
MQSIRFRLTAVLGGLALLLCAMMAVSYWATRTADESMKSVLADRDLKAISDAYAVDIVDTSHKVRGGSFTFDKGLESVQSSLGVIADRWKAYLQTHLTEEEKRLVAEAEAQKAKTDAGVELLVRILKSRQLPTIATFNDVQLYPIIEPMTAVIDKLVNYQIIEAEAEARRSALIHVDWPCGVRRVHGLGFPCCLRGRVAAVGPADTGRISHRGRQPRHCDSRSGPQG